MVRSKQSKEVFRFKQFEVKHSKSTLKVGTDAVLLGIYATTNSPKRILDIGTGTGVIALLLAQRYSKAQILGIDLDFPSIQEANYNFSLSPWSNRLEARQLDFNHYAKNNSNKFDLIVSNPPFFENDLRSSNPQLDKAKHAKTLTHDSLVQNVVGQLTETGIFSLIIPFDKAKYIIELAFTTGLFCVRRLDIFPKENKLANRCILEFQKTESIFQKESLVIYKEDNSYTKQYRLLGKEYYLNF
jgi:tRNA1Val (adenine37-N6)-methyltransferase